jgi:hypothetical protein
MRPWVPSTAPQKEKKTSKWIKNLSLRSNTIKLLKEDKGKLCIVTLGLTLGWGCDNKSRGNERRQM